MTSFEFFTVALSLVLGLGLSRLLLGFVHVFRARKRQTPHWVPLVWALSIFLLQVQFWWALYELTSLITTWTLVTYFSLLSIAVNLFVAGALILPGSGETERQTLLDYFNQDGRWAVLAVGIYAFSAIWVNWYLWEVSPVSWMGAFSILYGATAVGAALIQKTALRGSLTVLFLLEIVYGFAVLAPLEY